MKLSKRVYGTLYKALEGFRLGSLGSTLRISFLKRVAGSVGDNVFLGPRVTLVHPENLYIGNNVSIRQDAYIDCTDMVTIGDDVSIAHCVSIISFNHSYKGNGKIRENTIESKPITIQKDCWIGCRSVILPGVILGPRTIVGAGAVVTHSAKGSCILGGVPAKVIKDISPNEV